MIHGRIIKKRLNYIIYLLDMGLLNIVVCRYILLYRYYITHYLSVSSVDPISWPFVRGGLGLILPPPPSPDPNILVDPDDSSEKNAKYFYKIFFLLFCLFPVTVSNFAILGELNSGFGKKGPLCVHF